VKKLHREIMLSAVYQLSTENDTVGDGQGFGQPSLLARGPQAAGCRADSGLVLHVSGNLDKSVGGPSVELTPAVNRRTVYGKVSRYKLDEYLDSV
jgi:hypothetical protein